MRVAIPQLGGRVSPRGLLADTWMIAELDGATIVDRETRTVPLRDDTELLSALPRLGARLLVCGGLQREIAAQLGARGVRVIDNVIGPIGEVLEALRLGKLRSMHGFGSRRPTAVVGRG